MVKLSGLLIGDPNVKWGYPEERAPHLGCLSIDTTGGGLNV